MDTEPVDDARYSTASGWTITLEYSIRTWKYGVQRSRKAVHDWVQEADLQPIEGKSPDRIAVDETVIQIEDERYWLYATVDPASNHFLHMRLYTGRTAVLTKMFLRELK